MAALARWGRAEGRKPTPVVHVVQHLHEVAVSAQHHVRHLHAHTRIASSVVEHVRTDMRSNQWVSEHGCIGALGTPARAKIDPQEVFESV